jgi:hypothetical protein
LNAIAVGLVTSVAIASLLRLVLPGDAPLVGIAAPLSGIAIGAFLAGKVAKYAGFYHGALVGAAYVAAEAVGLAPAPFESVLGGIGESLWIIVGDALLLVMATASGWFAAPGAAPSSSAGRDRER